MEVNINRVQADKKIAEYILLGLRYVRKKSIFEIFARRKLMSSVFSFLPMAGCEPKLTLAPTAISSFNAFASTSPTSTPPSLRNVSRAAGHNLYTY